MKELFMIIKKIKFTIFFFLIFFCLQKNSLSFENKIVYKIDNEIITTIDIQNEINYLIALNPNLKKLNQDEIISISKKSVVRERIKKIEISNQFKNINFPEKLLEDLIKNLYLKIGKKNLEEFQEYLKVNNIEYKNVLQKIETEALWNELIYLKFSKKIKINLNKLKEQVNLEKDKEIKSYLMSEIIFEVLKKDRIEKKYDEIVKSIKINGFDNTALKYSISETSSIGGQLDWINENSLNQNIKNILSSMKVNDFTKPITVPGGFLILKINDIKIQKLETDIDKELEKLISVNKNTQLNQYSKIYFNKIKEDIEINEI